jgi:hypothetical protein
MVALTSMIASPFFFAYALLGVREASILLLSKAATKKAQPHPR